MFGNLDILRWLILSGVFFRRVFFSRFSLFGGKLGFHQSIDYEFRINITFNPCHDLVDFGSFKLQIVNTESAGPSLVVGLVNDGDSLLFPFSFIDLGDLVQRQPLTSRIAQAVFSRLDPRPLGTQAPKQTRQ